MKDAVFHSKINRLFDLFNQERPDATLVKVWFGIFSDWTDEQMDNAVNTLLVTKGKLYRGDNIAHMLKRAFFTWLEENPKKQAVRSLEGCPFCDVQGAIVSWRWSKFYGEYLECWSDCRNCLPGRAKATDKAALREAGHVVVESGEDWRTKGLEIENANRRIREERKRGLPQGQAQFEPPAAPQDAGNQGQSGGNFEVPRNETNQERRTTSDRQIPLVIG